MKKNASRCHAISVPGFCIPTGYGFTSEDAGLVAQGRQFGRTIFMDDAIPRDHGERSESISLPGIQQSCVRTFSEEIAFALYRMYRIDGMRNSGPHQSTIMLVGLGGVPAGVKLHRPHPRK